MPNHCSNSLTVTGPTAADFFAKVEAHGDDNFIAAFVPLPEPLTGIHTGGCTIDGEYVTKWRVDADGNNIAVSDIDLAYLTDLYGTADWYDWAIANWGTKWGAYDQHVADGMITFDSAWAPPDAAIRTISEMFPAATFELSFAEGGVGFYGSLTIKDGDVVDSYEGRDFWDETADPEDEDFPGTTPACGAFLEAHSLHTGG